MTADADLCWFLETKSGQCPTCGLVVRGEKVRTRIHACTNGPTRVLSEEEFKAEVLVKFPVAQHRRMWAIARGEA